MTISIKRLNIGSWVTHATCKPSDAERLDHLTGGQPTPTELAVRREAAEELCAHCPVRPVCALEADLNEEPGTWGGSLRYHSGGKYVVKPLIPEAAPSVCAPVEVPA